MCPIYDKSVSVKFEFVVHREGDICVEIVNVRKLRNLSYTWTRNAIPATKSPRIAFRFPVSKMRIAKNDSVRNRERFEFSNRLRGSPLDLSSTNKLVQLSERKNRYWVATLRHFFAFSARKRLTPPPPPTVARDRKWRPRFVGYWFIDEFFAGRRSSLESLHDHGVDEFCRLDRLRVVGEIFVGERGHQHKLSVWILGVRSAVNRQG